MFLRKTTNETRKCGNPQPLDTIKRTDTIGFGTVVHKGHVIKLIIS